MSSQHLSHSRCAPSEINKVRNSCCHPTYKMSVFICHTQEKPCHKLLCYQLTVVFFLKFTHRFYAIGLFTSKTSPSKHLKSHICHQKYISSIKQKPHLLNCISWITILHRFSKQPYRMSSFTDKC
jgi:hypothetical protein